MRGVAGACSHAGFSVILVAVDPCHLAHADLLGGAFDAMLSLIDSGRVCQLVEGLLVRHGAVFATNRCRGAADHDLCGAGRTLSVACFSDKIRNSSMQYRNADNATLSLHLWFPVVQKAATGG